MRKSEIDYPSWSFTTRRDDGNPWPELSPPSPVKYSACKKEVRDTGENNRKSTLDESEYPELGSTPVNSRNSVAARQQCPQNPTVEVLEPTSLDLEPKKSKRYKRTDKICFNLQEALQDTRCANKTTNKELAKFRINIYKGASGVTASNAADRNRNCNLRKVRICISKDKRLSKLKRIILLNRNMRAHVNTQRRQAFEREKMEAVCKDVDAINFKSLKIATDQEMDYVKHMCTMTLCEAGRVENIPESSVYHRPDIIEKINNLRIEGKCVSNNLAGNNNVQNPLQFHNNTIENDIVKQILSLEIKEGIKQEIKQEPQSNTGSDGKNFLMYSRNFREYCTNMLMPNLTNSLEILLREITRLQKRCHEKNPSKSKYKRRYYSGLKEVRKHVELRKVKFVIIAPDLEKVELEGGLDDQVLKLLDTCRMQNVVFCFGLGRRKLGYYSHGKGLVGCVGIANYSGAEELFKNVLVELVHARNAFKKVSGATDAIIDVSKLISDDHLLSENICTLLTILSPISIQC